MPGWSVSIKERPAQPLEKITAIVGGDIQKARQDRLRRDPEEGTDFQRGPVRRCGGLIHKAEQKRLHDVRCRLALTSAVLGLPGLAPGGRWTIRSLISDSASG
jgi:hypothetical protein